MCILRTLIMLNHNVPLFPCIAPSVCLSSFIVSCLLLRWQTLEESVFFVLFLHYLVSWCLGSCLDDQGSWARLNQQQQWPVNMSVVKILSQTRAIAAYLYVYIILLLYSSLMKFWFCFCLHYSNCCNDLPSGGHLL